MTQETALGRFRATLLVDRTGAEREDEAAAALELSQRLTRRYSDLPTAAAGEAFPVARLVEAVRQVCAKAASEIASIVATLVHGRRRADHADGGSDGTKSTPENGAAADDIDEMDDGPDRRQEGPSL